MQQTVLSCMDSLLACTSESRSPCSQNSVMRQTGRCTVTHGSGRQRAGGSRCSATVFLVMTSITTSNLHESDLLNEVQYCILIIVLFLDLLHCYGTADHRLLCHILPTIGVTVITFAHVYLFCIVSILWTGASPMRIPLNTTENAPLPSLSAIQFQLFVADLPAVRTESIECMFWRQKSNRILARSLFLVTHTLRSCVKRFLHEHDDTLAVVSPTVRRIHDHHRSYVIWSYFCISFFVRLEMPTSF